MSNSNTPLVLSGSLKPDSLLPDDQRPGPIGTSGPSSSNYVSLPTEEEYSEIASLSSSAISRKSKGQQAYEKRQKKKKIPRAASKDAAAVMNQSADDEHARRLADLDVKIEKLQELEAKAQEANQVEAKVDAEIDLNRRTWDTTVGRVLDGGEFLKCFDRIHHPWGDGFRLTSEWLPIEQFSRDHIINVVAEDVGHVRNVTMEVAAVTGFMIPKWKNWIIIMALKALKTYLKKQAVQRGLAVWNYRFPEPDSFIGGVAEGTNKILDLWSGMNVAAIYSGYVVLTFIFNILMTNWRLMQQVADVQYEITVYPRFENEPFLDLRAVSTLHNRLLRTVMPARYELVVKKRIPTVGYGVLMAIPSIIRRASPAPLANHITYESVDVQRVEGVLSLELLAELVSADKARTSLTVGDAMARVNEMSTFVGSFNFNRFDFTPYSQGSVVVAQAITKSRLLKMNVGRKSVLTDF